MAKPPPPPGAPGKLRLLKRSGGIFQPDIWIVDAKKNPRVWKTWWRRPAWERNLLCARLARREGRIIAQLQDCEGFPTFLSHPDPWTVEMSLLDAEPVPEGKQCGALPPEYFDHLAAMLAIMHGRGINHGDLRRKNLLQRRGDPASPVIVDFTQSLHIQPPARGIRGFVLREAIRIDRVTLLKLKRWYLGEESMTEEERHEEKDIPWHLTLGRAVRQGIYRPLRKWREASRARE